MNKLFEVKIECRFWVEASDGGAAWLKVCKATETYHGVPLVAIIDSTQTGIRELPLNTKPDDLI